MRNRTFKLDDQEILALAEAVMKARGTPTVTAAIRLALQNEVRRADKDVSLHERVAFLRSRALARADLPRLPALGNDERDQLWGHVSDVEVTTIPTGYV